MKAKTIISFVSLVVGMSLSAQDFSIHTLPTQQQLPVANVHCIFQDSEGYMWYGTEGGLCRDNGYQIDVFRPSALESYAVSCIAEDRKGNILYGTADRLYSIDKSDYTQHVVELDSARHPICTIFSDSRHHLWVGTYGTLFECSEEGEIVKSHPCQIDGRPASVVSFYEDQQGTLYALQLNGGILHKRQDEKAFSPLQWTSEATPLNMIEDTQHHRFWVATGGEGIQRMTIAGNVCQLTPQPATMGDIKRKRALQMLCDNRNGLFWTTTHDDLYAYQLDSEGNLQEFPLTGLLPAGRKILDQMFQDKDGNLYVSGFTPHTFIISASHKDIRRISADAIRRHTGYPLLADRSVCDGPSHIWIWQGRQGLMLYNQETDQVEMSPVHGERTIQASSLGGIWASNGAVVYRLWQANGQVRDEVVAKVQEGTRIRCLHEKDGEALYVATEQKLYRLTLKGRQLSTITDLPSAPHEIAVTEEGVIYLAMGKEGLLRVGPEGKKEQIGQVAESFLSVCTMADGSVWASTNEGHVYHYNPANNRLSQELLLSSPNRATITCIRTDGLGHVWTMTNQQVCEYAPQSQAFRTFRNSDPFIDVSYFYALEASDASRMCIDGAGAIIEVQSSPELSIEKNTQVLPRLTALLIGGVKRLVGRDVKTLHLAANEEDFTMELSTLDHLHAQSISFAYQFSNNQDKWIYLPQGSNSIVVTNLSKGNHHLRVMATDKHGLWSQPVDIITLQRAPHWWETWWAYLLYIAIAATLIYGIWLMEHRIHILRRLIRRRQEVRLDEIEIKREDIAEQQRDDEFLRRAIAKTEEHLSDPNYNVESLSADMCMSRITLYRHIQEQTGQTPTDFIRDIRLKKAAALLSQHPEAAISDVARKVGFATPKYFSRCFKEKFGVLPKDYHTSTLTE